MLAEDKIPGSDVKGNSLLTGIAVGRVSTFLHCFPQPQFLWGDTRSQVAPAHFSGFCYKRGT